jgi:hypothetical protein
MKALAFGDLSARETYFLLRRAANEMASGRQSKSGPVFRDEDGLVNLVGGRGLKGTSFVENKNVEFDDSIFVVSRVESRYRVFQFALSAELGRGYEDSADALLLEGHHRYRLGFHNVRRGSQYGHAILSETDHFTDVGRRQYRALEPEPGVPIARDTNHNHRLDTGEQVEGSNRAINIHWGGEWTVGSAGCQVIQHWTQYKAFVRLVEEDHSIVGTIDDELAPRPAVDGTRFVTYTLMTGDFLQEVYRRHFVRYLPVRISGSGPGPQAATPEAADLAAFLRPALQRADQHAWRRIEVLAGPGGGGAPLLRPASSRSGSPRHGGAPHQRVAARPAAGRLVCRSGPRALPVVDGSRRRRGGAAGRRARLAPPPDAAALAAGHPANSFLPTAHGPQRRATGPAST